jgi:hypothetical protein
MMLQRLPEAGSGTAIEVFVQQDFRPDRHPDRAFGNQSWHRRGRHDPWDVRTATPLVVALTLDMTDMRLDLDFNDGGFFGTRKRSERLPTDGAAFLPRAQVLDFDDDRECGTGTAAVPRTAGLLASLAGAG